VNQPNIRSLIYQLVFILVRVEVATVLVLLAPHQVAIKKCRTCHLVEITDWACATCEACIPLTL